MAYGARLESVLGESPQGFESPILRQCDFSRDRSHSGSVRCWLRSSPVASSVAMGSSMSTRTRSRAFSALTPRVVYFPSATEGHFRSGIEPVSPDLVVSAAGEGVRCGLDDLALTGQGGVTV